MRHLILLSMLLGGCYAVHEPHSEPSRASAREAVPIPDAGTDPDAVTPCSEDFVVTDREAADAEPSCSAFCDACPSFGPRDECVTACTLRYAVAFRNGCAADFPAWTECLASTCDASACRSVRTCW